MAEENKMKRFPVSMQPDIEDLLKEISPADFAPATKEERDDFIQERQSVSYWKDAWRRLKKNVVAMVALGVIIFLILFAFVGPYLIPYGYEQFNKGAENLYPYHYTLEDQKRLDAEIAARTETEVLDVDQMIAKAEEEAAARGEKLSSVDRAKIKAQAKVAAQKSASAEHDVDPNELRKELGIKKHMFGYSAAELERKAGGGTCVPSYLRYGYVRQRYLGARNVRCEGFHGSRYLCSPSGAVYRCGLRVDFGLLRRKGRCRDAAYCGTDLFCT